MTTSTDVRWSLYDYISPGLRVVTPDDAFPHMREGDALRHPWKYLRRDVPHRWYSDERYPLMGFLNRDEAVLLHNIALQFAGKRALEIGSWMGWSTCHLALAGVEVDVIDPAHDDPERRASIEDSLRRAGVADRVHLVGGRSPETIEALDRRWSLLFIDGDHEAPAPLRDTIAALPYANYDCAFVFHDLAAPAVAEPVRYLQEQGFQVLVYQTAQIMAIAWRGNVTPVAHTPDPNVAWQIPPHLFGLPIAGVDRHDSTQREYRLLREQTYAGAAERPSVCIVTSELIGPFNNGGVGTAMTGLAELLASQNHSVTVLYTGTLWAPDIRLSPWIEHYAKRGIELIPITLDRGAGLEGPLKDLGLIAPWLIYEELRRRSFDVIHFNDCCGQGSLCLAAKAVGLAFRDSLLVVALHSPSSWVYELNHQLPAARACAAYDYSERVSIAAADVVWSPSRYLLDWAAERGFRLPEQTFVQQYALPSPADRPPSSTRSGPPTEIVFFGRLEERKGLRMFCNAVQELAPDLAARNIGVTFLGKPQLCGGIPSLEYIAKRSASWRFPVQTLTELGQPESLRYLQEGSGKLAVMASPVDNSPCTVYEALAAGMPFLAARSGGIPELVAAEDRDRVLFEPRTAALRGALRDAIDHGAWTARPAVAADETRRSWLDMHAHWRDLLPKPPAASRPMKVLAIVDHDAGAPLLTTLEPLWKMASVHRILILNRSGDDLPFENIDLLSAEPPALSEQLETITEDAVLLIHSGAGVDPERFAPMLDALRVAAVDGLVPATRVTGARPRVIPPLGGSVPFSLIDGVTAGGGVLVRRDALHRGMKGRSLAIDAPFLGIADFCVTRSETFWPYPEPVLQHSAGLQIRAKSSLPGRIAPYGDVSASDRYYILAAGYDAAVRPPTRQWIRPIAYAAIDSGFGILVRVAARARQRLRKWMKR